MKDPYQYLDGPDTWAGPPENSVTSRPCCNHLGSITIGKREIQLYHCYQSGFSFWGVYGPHVIRTPEVVQAARDLREGNPVQYRVTSE